MDKSKLKLVFMGTPEISAKVLSGLLGDGYDIIGVVTEPDKPVGKKQILTPSAVKLFAQEKGLKVFQPEKKADVASVTKELNPDLVVVAAYGKIINKDTLDVPRYGCINFHASLLPKLRGPSPIQTAILQGFKETGVTIMVMDEGMDTGPMLSQVTVKIDDKETTATLKEKLLQNGLELLLQTVPGYIEGDIKPIAQPDTEATYCKMIEKEDGKIDFSKSAIEEARKLRAFNEWPGSFCFWEEKRIKIVSISDLNTQVLGLKNGEVFLDENKNLCLKFADGYWAIQKLQMEGKNMLNAKDFLNGNGGMVGAVLK